MAPGLRFARLQAELAYARTECREWARRDERLTNDERDMKRRAMVRAHLLECRLLEVLGREDN